MEETAAVSAAGTHAHAKTCWSGDQSEVDSTQSSCGTRLTNTGGRECRREAGRYHEAEAGKPRRQHETPTLEGAHASGSRGPTLRSHLSNTSILRLLASKYPAMKRRVDEVRTDLAVVMPVT